MKRALIIEVGGQESPQADSERLADTLHRRGGFKAIAITAPSRDRLHAALIEAFEDPGLAPADELLVYYRGQVLSGPDGWDLAATDTDPGDPGTALDAAVLAELADRCRARTAAVLLECRSAVPPPGHRIDLSRAAGRRGTVVIAADDGTGSGPGGFTAAVVEALEGAAAQTGTDGWITAWDLAEHLAAAGYPAAGNGGAVPAPLTRVRDTPSLGPRNAARVRPRRPEPREEQEPGDDPWQAVLAYWRDCRRAEDGLAAGIDLLEPAASVIWPAGHETVLSGPAGLVDLPPAVSRFRSRREDADHYYGYPLLLVRADHGRRLVPLLVAPLAFDGAETAEAETVTVNPLLLDGLDTPEAAGLDAALAADFTPGDPDQLAERLRDLIDALGLETAEPIDPTGLSAGLPLGGPPGVYNLAATWRAGRDRRAFAELAKMRRRGGTALAAVEHPETAETGPAPILIDPFGLGPEQEAVVDAAMRRPLTAVTLGPATGSDPGTAAATVAALCATAQAAGQTVLLASGAPGTLPHLLAAADKAGPGLVTLVPVGEADGGSEGERLERLIALAAEPDDREALTAAVRECGERIADLRGRLERRTDAEHALKSAREHRERIAKDSNIDAYLRRAADAGDERIELVLAELGRASDGRFTGAAARRRLRTDFGTADPEDRGRLHDAFECERHLRRCQRALDECEPADKLEAQLSNERSQRAEHGRALAEAETGRRTRKAANALQRRLNAIERGDFDRDGIAALVPDVPGWAVATDQVHRLPAVPALFDLVIIDAATACPLPEALALLLRAERAVLLSGPQEPGRRLHEAVDNEIRRAHGLPAQWTAARGLRYSDGTAWDLCAPVADHLVLGGPARTASAVTDTRGRIEPDAPGSWTNPPEAELLIERAVDLATSSFGGRLAIACPFRAQADLIAAELAALGLGERVPVLRPGQPIDADTLLVSTTATHGLPARDAQWVLAADGLWADCTTAPSRLELFCDRTWWTGRPGPLPRLLPTP